jgi:hypothetical protein
MSNVVNLFLETKNESIILTDELLDLLAEAYLVEKNDKFPTFEKFVEFKIWELSQKIKSKQ